MAYDQSFGVTAELVKVLVDAMGGDNAPKEIVLGALKAKDELGVDIVLLGKEDEIRPYKIGRASCRERV